MLENTIPEAPKEAATQKNETLITQPKLEEQKKKRVEEFQLCMVAVEKFWVEKDIIKFCRKSFASNSPPPKDGEPIGQAA